MATTTQSSPSGRAETHRHRTCTIMPDVAVLAAGAPLAIPVGDPYVAETVRIGQVASEPRDEPRWQGCRLYTVGHGNMQGMMRGRAFASMYYGVQAVRRKHAHRGQWLEKYATHRGAFAVPCRVRLPAGSPAHVGAPHVPRPTSEKAEGCTELCRRHDTSRSHQMVIRAIRMVLSGFGHMLALLF